MQPNLPNTTPSTVTTNAVDLIKHLEERAEPSQLTVTRGTDGEAHVLAVPRGLELKSAKPFLDELRTVPERRKGVAVLTRLVDFIAHINRFKSADTVVFVDTAKPLATAVYDYHPAGPNVFNAANLGHGARHAFPFSPAFKAWRDISGKSLTATQFAAFLTEHAADVLSGTEAPACAAELTALELTVGTPDVLRRLAKGLRVSVSEEFEEARTLENGDVALSFTRKTNSTKDAKGQEIKVPGGFVVGVPMTDGADAITAIPAVLRFDHDGSLTWTITLLHLDALMEQTVDAAAKRIEGETGCPVFYGSSE